MYRLGPALSCDLDELLYVQVAFCRGCWADVVGLVSEAGVQGFPVWVRLDGDACYSHLAQRANDADGDLTPVGDQHLLEHQG